MKHFATFTLPDGVYACTANPDGTIPLSSRAVARNDQADKDGNNLRYLLTQANMAIELFDALAELVARCDGAEGVRADGSNIQTMRAHAVLEKARELQ